MLITPADVAALQTTLSLQFQEGWNGAEVYWPMLATEVPSNSADQLFAAMARLPTMREWIGPRILQNIQGHTYRLTNRTYELTISVEREQWEDDNLGWTRPFMSEVGRQGRKQPDRLVREALQSGTVTTGPGGAGFDGLPYFSASHDLDPAGVQSNNITGNPLTAANYETSRAAMRAITGEDGEPMGIVPRLLVVPPALEMTALRIVNSDLVPNTAGTASETNVLKGSAEVLVVDELENEPTVWYLMDVSRGIKPLIWQVRRPLAMTSKNTPNDDGVFFDNEFVWGIDQRGVVGYGPWFLAQRNIA